jgi:hypothetical protein
MSMRLQLRTLPPYPVAKPSVGVHVSKDFGSTKTDEPTRDIYIYIYIYIYTIIYTYDIQYSDQSHCSLSSWCSFHNYRTTAPSNL